MVLVWRRGVLSFRCWHWLWSINWVFLSSVRVFATVRYLVHISRVSKITCPLCVGWPEPEGCQIMFDGMQWAGTGSLLLWKLRRFLCSLLICSSVIWAKLRTNLLLNSRDSVDKFQIVSSGRVLKLTYDVHLVPISLQPATSGGL